MKIKSSTRQMLKILYIISWIIFVDLCVEAGSFIVNVLLTLAHPVIITPLLQQIDLTELFRYNQKSFFVIAIITTIVMVIKAIMFYLIIKLLHDKKLDMAKPFNKDVQRFILKLSYWSFVIGLFSWQGIRYAEWLPKQQDVASNLDWYLGGANIWMFMAIILFVVAQIFKRGIEMQQEQDLTI